MLTIGQLTIPVPFFQASLSGYSDYPMRILAKQFGCPLTFAGVMLAQSAAHPKILKKPLFRPYEDEHPVVAQLLGEEPEIFVEAAQAVVSAGYDMVDLNFGCPVPKVLSRGRGGALLKDPQTIRRIYRAVREAVDCPVMMKLRIGFNRSEQAQDQFMRIVSDAVDDGVDALVIHGRTVIQRYRDRADWAYLAKVKRQFPKAVIIGSGDLFEATDIVDKVRTSKLDGVAIARGAVGNPWIFRDLTALFNNQPRPPRPTLTEQKEVILEHYKMTRKLFHQRKAIGFFRKFMVGYARLHPQRKKVMLDAFAAKTDRQFADAVNRWYD